MGHRTSPRGVLSLLSFVLAVVAVPAMTRTVHAAGAAAATPTTPVDGTKDGAKPSDGKDGKDGKDDEGKDDDAPSPESPRVSLEAYLNLCRDGKYKEAAAYLDLSQLKDADPAVMARRLKAVLDRYVWLDLDKISGKPAGNLDDGLSANLEDIAKIPSDDGSRTPARMSRDYSKDRWVFNRTTVSHIDGWYQQLDDRWLLERLPQALLRPGPRDILWWQWIALPLVLGIAAAFGALGTRATKSVLESITKRTEVTWDDAIVARLRGPLWVALTMVFTLILLPFLQLYPPSRAFLHQLVRGALLADFFWVLARLIDAGAAIGRKHYWSAAHATSRALIPLATRVGKVVVLFIAIVAFLSELGYPVASLVAGLGLGGLAFALAAQKTVENLFGAFSIGADQPFREGDTIKVDDLTGTVEVIGLRSTKIRTADRTIVTIPNGSLAEKRLESLAARDRLHFATNLFLVRQTTSAQMRAVLKSLAECLNQQEKIFPDSASVFLTEIAESSLKVEVNAWFTVSDAEYARIRQDLLLRFLEIVEAAGSSLAYPTRSLQLSSQDGLANDVGRDPESSKRRSLPAE